MITTTQNITLRLRKGTPECKALVAAVNQGIDAHLEAVTQSRFEDAGSTLDCSLDRDDCKVLLRRLDEDGYAASNVVATMIRHRLNVGPLDAFTLAYITAALWTETDGEEHPLEDNYGPEDIDEGALASIIADCRKFQGEHGIPEYRDGKWTDAEMAGHDFWLTRNGHGVGFWDRDALSEDDQKKYTDAAEAFGECNLYVGDDGKLYVT